jgi:nucleoside-diphosphate-sugar epimerase
MYNKRILIVGGAGYIGGYLTDYLSALNYSVTVYDSLLYESRYLKKVPFIYGDICDTTKLLTLLPKYDIVIWLAAIVGDGACATNPSLSRLINEESVKWLADHYQGKIIFMSTCSVYGINNDLIDETAEPHPLSVYAETKLGAEKYLLAQSKNCLIFRLGTLYGLSDEHSRIRLDLVVNVLTQKATMGEKLTVYGGEQWRPLLHVQDVSTAIAFGIETNSSGLYNLSEKNYKICESAEQVRSTLPNTQVEYVEKQYEDLRNYRVTAEKYKQHGWKPLHPLSKGILEIHTMLKEQRIKNVKDPVYSNEFYLKGVNPYGEK